MHGLVIPLSVNWNLRTPRAQEGMQLRLYKQMEASSDMFMSPVARRLAPLIRGGEVSHASAEVIGTSRPAPEGTWTQGGGIEIPCKYILKGNKAYKKNVRNAFA